MARGVARTLGRMRRWNDEPEWNGSACNASGWELTEPDQGYQGPFVLMVSFFMSR